VVEVVVEAVVVKVRAVMPSLENVAKVKKTSFAAYIASLLRQAPQMNEMKDTLTSITSLC
jgi:hypothetical protein